MNNSKNKLVCNDKGFSLTSDELIDRVVNFVDCRPNEKILDLGCGSGTIISKINNRGMVFGLELSKNSLLLAKKKDVDGLVMGSGTFLPFKDGFFDKVLCFHVLEHLACDESQVMLLEIKRVLKKGGFVFLGIPIMESSGLLVFWFRKNILRQRNVFDAFGATDHKCKYSRRRLISLFNENGFKITSKKMYNLIVVNKLWQIFSLHFSFIHKIPIALDALYIFKNI